MSSANEKQIRDKIYERHGGDKSQLIVIFSPHDRLLVEAPAGYGKTSTMVSKIAYMIATNKIPYPKRLLALTFSVNAAYKIKKDVSAQVPELLSYAGIEVNVRDKVVVSNYHGFSRNVLRKYGNIFHESMMDIDIMLPIDDADAKQTQETVKGLVLDDAMLLSDFSNALKNVDTRFLTANWGKYNDLVVQKLLPRRVIPYNAIITLTIRLFKENLNILGFYHNYLPAILVDEYQDTNALAYALVSLLITDKSKVILLGDALQRIYGFIGAVPGLLDSSEKKFRLQRLQLATNHRFADNNEMLLLDSNIRRNAEQPSGPNINKEVRILVDLADDQPTEALRIAMAAKSLVQQNVGKKVAVLLRGRGPNADAIIKAFQENNVPYFFALFTDEDPDYVAFHKRCKAEFDKLMRNRSAVTKAVGAEHLHRVEEIYGNKPSYLFDALISLLRILWEKVFSDFSFLTAEEKLQLVEDTFDYNCLRQYIEFVKADITISTVHAAKGLEWDFVLLPDMEQAQFPSYYGLCSKCRSISNCSLRIDRQLERPFLEELSVFYVAVTRARKQVRFSASKSRLDRFGNSRACELSCFLKLPGILPATQ